MARPHSTRKPAQRAGEPFVVTLPSDLLDRFERLVPEAERGRFVERVLQAALTEPEPGAAAATISSAKRR